MTIVIIIDTSPNKRMSPEINCKKGAISTTPIESVRKPNVTYVPHKTGRRSSIRSCILVERGPIVRKIKTPAITVASA